MNEEAQLRRFLSAVRRRWFASHALGTVARSAAVASVPGAVALVLFWLFSPSGFPLIVLAAFAIAAATAGVAVVVWRASRRPDDRQVARYIEERAAALPEGVAFDDALVTAIDSRASSDPAMGRLLVHAAVRRLVSVAPEQIVPPQTLRRGAARAGLALVALAAVLTMAVGPLDRAGQSASLLLFPERIRIDVTPGDVRLVAGEPLKIRAVVFSGNRPLPDAAPLLVVSAGDEQRTVAMQPHDGAYEFPFESVDRSFRYQVRAGSAASDAHQVTALTAPRVERIELRYHYPSFTGLQPRHEEDGGDIYAPAGTRVTLRIHADKPVSSGVLAYGRGASGALRQNGARVLETELVLARDDSYRVHLADRDGLRAAHETEYFIRVMDDRPPDVRILRPAGDQQITPLEEVTIEARAEDDYGVAALDLVYAVPGGRMRVVALSTEAGSGTTRAGAHLLAAEELGVKPGDVITYYARARDVARGKRSTEARSDMYFLEVRPFGEEFVAAQSQAGGGGPVSAQLESLIAAQKEIINATWTIERRTVAGRSAEDIDAVARAQAELRARAEQMTARRGRGRFNPPLQVSDMPGRGQGPSRDAVATAVEAMARAFEHLQGRRTGDALPHEMAALQALLQAQADVRRHEVMQQQANGGSGGSGRQGQDLSALFDKELQRQQRTNYETRSQIEERADTQDRDSALDRIRDLARRQEDLARREQELADSRASAEERRRQRERLTREQLELQQQAEEIARSMNRGEPQRASASGEGRRGASAGAASEAQGASGKPGEERGGETTRQLQRASEHMKSAAGELGRDDARSAAERAARASAALQALEEQLRRDSPEARRRAAGELQLEAQQIADEQRRIAAEASRLDAQAGDAGADARRRLAGDKDRLADRTDALQQSASALASATPGAGGRSGTDAPSVGNAARELEKQQLGARMRNTAKQLREGTAGRTDVAAAEEQIAGALDRVVDMLGGGSAETRALSGQLDQTRALRARLDELERRIADADRRIQQEHAGRAGGRSGEGGGERSGGVQAELTKLREEYARELRAAREQLAKLGRSAPQSGAAGTTPEQHEWSQADPGTQGFKQDFSGWASLRKDINLALERTEASVSARLAQQAARDRLHAGGSDRVPDAYRQLIARYYESLTRARK